MEDELDTMTSITSDLAEKTADQKERDLKKWVEMAKKNIWNVLIPKLNNETSKSKGMIIFYFKISSLGAYH